MYERIYDWRNLLLAYRKAAKGKRGQANVAAFEYHLEDYLLHLQTELRSQTYCPGSYDSFYIHEPKKRLISAAPFRDRVVHHALCNLIEPVFERGFSPASFANRKKMGTHCALDRTGQYLGRYPFFLQCDVCQFFPSIDHAILRSVLAHKIFDERVRWLCDQILESGQGVLAEEYEMVYFASDNLLAAFRPRGLPIGNLTSQFWANVYLTGLDHFIQRELGCRGYVRYVDDIVLFADSKTVLWDWKALLERRLAALRLTIHPGAHPRPVEEGLPFLGFVLFPYRRRLKRRKGIRMARKLRHLAGEYRAGRLPLARLTASVQGWCNHARYANTVGLRKAVLNQVRLHN